MNDQVKKIVEILNKKPFEKELSAIAFHSLGSEQLIQLMNDILAHIDSRHAGDIREEAPDARAGRILNALKNLKYSPPPNADVSSFRQGIVLGEKEVYCPILFYLLTNLDSLKTRAYLAKFLVKLQLPPEFVQDFSDAQMQEAWHRYEELQDHFLNCHKEYVDLKKQSHGTGEIRSDITTMEEEKENLSKRVTRLRKKVETFPNLSEALSTAQNMRKEKERADDLKLKIQQQRRQLQLSEQRLQNARQSLQDARQAGSNANPESIIGRMEEDNRVNKYLIDEKLPKEMKSRKKFLQSLQQVALEPAITQNDLDRIESDIQDMKNNINSLVEQRMVKNYPAKDNLTMYRQQASILQHKKETVSESLQETQEEFQKLESDVKKKRQQLTEMGGEVLRGEAFKNYVSKLRGKSNNYKKSRQELSDLRAEHGVLSRTEQLLKQKHEDAQKTLRTRELKSGVSGFRDTQDDLEKVSSMKSELDDAKHRTLDDMSDAVKRLNSIIQDKKSDLAPQIRELRPLRQKNQELMQEWTEKKGHYDGVLAGLESNRAQLEQTVTGLREFCSETESRYFYLKSMNKIIEVQLERANKELRTYMSATGADKQKSYREIYNKKIQEQENRAKALRESQKQVRENHDQNQKQMLMWSDLDKIMQCKLDCAKKMMN
ncbi:intraflagellar transport protein 81 homolog [Styela clava]|uniref:intraflagellar transport protein 81 homolog n=1 Tax=Styela clava TaxID=7725 RepID=UPI0019396CB8|nr:intraflagellar transport protein 81 homolog [Styela clava]